MGNDARRCEAMADRYHILREIGRGAMGRVYLAHDGLLERDVALKELAVPDYITDEEREEVWKRFRTEAKAAARLTHPHVVVVHDIVASGDRQFIVMEYLEGKTLREILGERTFSPAEATSIASMIGEALDYAHSQGIIHRDVKPDNIFVLESGNIKVADFGISKILKVSDHTHTDVIMGTPNYIAPEVIRGLPFDHRVDVFALGVTLYEILAGRRPFDADNEYAIIFKVTGEDPVPLQELRDDLPPSLVRAVHRALEKDPGRRYPNMKEFKEDLLKVRAELGMATGVEEEQPFDKEQALQSELRVAMRLGQEAEEPVEARGYDFRRDKEWKELIARIYQREPEAGREEGEVPVGGAGGGVPGAGAGGEGRGDGGSLRLPWRGRGHAGGKGGNAAARPPGGRHAGFPGGSRRAARDHRSPAGRALERRGRGGGHSARGIRPPALDRRGPPSRSRPDRDNLSGGDCGGRVDRPRLGMRDAPARGRRRSAGLGEGDEGPLATQPARGAALFRFEGLRGRRLRESGGHRVGRRAEGRRLGPVAGLGRVAGRLVGLPQGGKGRALRGPRPNPCPGGASPWPPSRAIPPALAGRSAADSPRRPSSG